MKQSNAVLSSGVEHLREKFLVASVLRQVVFHCHCGLGVGWGCQVSGFGVLNWFFDVSN